jgi:hypothetical protein
VWDFYLSYLLVLMGFLKKIARVTRRVPPAQELNPERRHSLKLKLFATPCILANNSSYLQEWPAWAEKQTKRVIQSVWFIPIHKPCMSVTEPLVYCAWHFYLSCVKLKEWHHNVPWLAAAVTIQAVKQAQRLYCRSASCHVTLVLSVIDRVHIQRPSRQ